MKKKTLSQRIEEYLAKRNCFVNGGELERLALNAGYKASNASRQARQLAEDGLIERDTNRDKKHTVWYKTKKPMKKIAYRDVETGEIIATTYERAN